MGKKYGNKAVLTAIYANDASGIIGGVVVQKNGVVRARISSHKKINRKKLDK